MHKRMEVEKKDATTETSAEWTEDEKAWQRVRKSEARMRKLRAENEELKRKLRIVADKGLEPGVQELESLNEGLEAAKVRIRERKSLSLDRTSCSHSSKRSDRKRHFTKPL
jgi:hypothetical protein